MTDLSRIPEQHRARVEREMSAAWGAASERADDAHPPWTCEEVATNANIAAGEEAAAAVLARYLEIADQADAAAHEAFMSRSTGDMLDREDDAKAARLAVWSRELAKIDGEAAADAEQAVRAAQRAHLDRTRPAFTGTVQTEARLDIHDAAGLRAALDGLVRYLVDKPGETLRTIAALVRTLPVGLCPSVMLATDNRRAFDLLAAQESPTIADRGGSRSVWAIIDGVDFGAAARTPRTTLERAHDRIAALPLGMQHVAAQRLSRSYSTPAWCVAEKGCRIEGAEVVWPDDERWPIDPDQVTP